MYDALQLIRLHTSNEFEDRTFSKIEKKISSFFGSFLDVKYIIEYSLFSNNEDLEPIRVSITLA